MELVFVSFDMNDKFHKYLDNVIMMPINQIVRHTETLVLMILEYTKLFSLIFDLDPVFSLFNPALLVIPLLDSDFSNS